jgi:hypothetical protein
MGLAVWVCGCGGRCEFFDLSLWEKSRISREMNQWTTNDKNFTSRGPGVFRWFPKISEAKATEKNPIELEKNPIGSRLEIH